MGTSSLFQTRPTSLSWANSPVHYIPSFSRCQVFSLFLLFWAATTYSISQGSSNPKTGCGVGHQLPPFLAVPANKHIGSSSFSIFLMATKKIEGTTKSNNFIPEIKIIITISTLKFLPPKTNFSENCLLSIFKSGKY